jgi:hypothetical protein
VRIYGIDFTSAPTSRKPLTVAMCRMEGDALYVDALCALESLECFGNLLNTPGPWMAGMDFPFGLPRSFLEPLHWKPDWESYVRAAGAMERNDFRDLARSVAAAREPGHKYCLREVDRLARAQSPMNVVRPPVGLMFHAGAPQLLASGATIVPVRAGDPDRIVVEAYPKLVAEALIGRRSYKDESDPMSGADRVAARTELVETLQGDTLDARYGFGLSGLAALASELVDDPRGDCVDALMCAVQAAWAWRLRDDGFGLPRGADTAEGWIADPVTAVTA